MDYTEQKKDEGHPAESETVRPEAGRTAGKGRVYRTGNGVRKIGRLTDSGSDPEQEEWGEYYGWQAESRGVEQRGQQTESRGAEHYGQQAVGHGIEYHGQQTESRVAGDHSRQAASHGAEHYGQQVQSSGTGEHSQQTASRGAEHYGRQAESRAEHHGQQTESRVAGDHRRQTAGEQVRRRPARAASDTEEQKKSRPERASRPPRRPAHRDGQEMTDLSAESKQEETEKKTPRTKRTESPARKEQTGERTHRRSGREAASEETSGAGWQEKLKARRKKRVKYILAGMGGVMAAAYIAVAVYFGSHFYEDTQIYGIDCSQKTLEEVKLEVAEKLDEYYLTIQERQDKTETVSAEDIGLKFVDNGSIDRMLQAQHSYLWPVMMLLERNSMASVSFDYDRQRVEEKLNMLDCFDHLHEIEPKDAYIGDTDTGFEVVPEVMGTTLDREKTLNVVLAALDAGSTEVSLEEKDCYVNPQVYQDDEELVSDAAAMSELAKASITYDFGSSQEVVDASVIRDWIVELADGSFVIDDICVSDFVEAMAAKYDTFGLPIEFYTSLGTTVTLSGGDYGWCIDKDQTVVELLKALESGYRGEMEPVYLYSAMSHENNGIGYTYVEICISQQRMWCYQDGNCVVDTPVVTGNPNKGNATPSGGVWAIDAKKRDAILTGEGYTAPVDYWMPFNGDVGIHDLKQRAYFGGTIYLSNGSHGCVNTPYDQVQIIYETVSIGTPVIVYD